MVKIDKVSVLIPIYNTEKYLPNCLDSIINQTHTNIEIICINDGSTDSSLDILNRYSKEDDRIKIISQENKGVSVTRNILLENANSEYILFVDSDDSIHHQLIECCLKIMNSDNVDVVSFMESDNIIKDDINVANISYYIANQNSLEHLKQGNKWKLHIPTWSRMYRKSVVENIRFIDGIFHEDLPHTAELFSNNPRTAITDLKLYFRNHHNDSITGENLSVEHIRGFSVGLLTIYEIFKDSADLDFALKVFFNPNLKYILRRILKSPKDKRKELWQAFAKLLSDIDKVNCLRLRDHKFYRYIAYKLIMTFKR